MNIIKKYSGILVCLLIFILGGLAGIFGWRIIPTTGPYRTIITVLQIMLVVWFAHYLIKKLIKRLKENKSVSVE